MKIFKIIKKILRAVTALSVIFYCPQYCCDGAVEIQVRDWYGLERELPIIKKVAERNGCQGEDFLILLAIRKAEAGSPGREFGVLHPICQALINLQPQNSLDIQAGWAAATIVKNRKRWNQIRDIPVDFIDFLANRYCPAAADKTGNINFKKNVRYWYGRFRREAQNQK